MTCVTRLVPSAKSCNAKYGKNGWLGLAQIWLSGTHIAQATAKMNDTYFSTAAYNVPVKKQHVMCQEIGHDWGLGHQDESGADLNTCMDYANALDNPSPNQHDYDQLQTIYQHLDSTTTINAAGAMPDAVPSWAPATQRSQSVYVDRLADGSITTTSVSIVVRRGQTWRILARGSAHRILRTSVCDGSRKL